MPEKTATIDDVPAAWEAVVAHGRGALTRHQTGDFADVATSEADPFAPGSPIQFFVPVGGGRVTADVLGPERRHPNGDLIDDPWTYDHPFGVELSAAEVAALIGGE